MKCAKALGALLILSSAQNAWSQGCVVARGSGVPPTLLALMNAHDTAATSGWATFASYRWLNSDRHFVGSEEQKERRHEGSEVINQSHFADLSFTYAFNDRYSMALVVPWVTHDRSQVVRDGQRTILRRFHTQATGVGDVRLMGYGWLHDPSAHRRSNVLFGLGIEAPTGDEDVEDTFLAYDNATRSIVQQRRTVDQSIQPGDGGWAAVVDLYAHASVTERIAAFFNGSYSVTPEEKSGVPTFRSNPFESVMSISDSYMARAGVDVSFGGAVPVSLSLAARIEGVPVHDLVGGSDGFRRPGYSVAIEPGVNVSFANDVSITAFVPFAVYRNRQRSVADRQLTEATGTYRHGDAAFADYTVSIAIRKGF
jgi:hypothetical protein